MTYDPDNAVERKVPDAGTTVTAYIIDIQDGKIKDFVTKPEALKKFDSPDALAIYVTTEGKYEGRSYRCETLFSYAMVNNKIEYDARSNLASFKKIYSALPKVGQEVKHIANGNGYFKLLVKV